MHVCTYTCITPTQSCMVLRKIKYIFDMKKSIEKSVYSAWYRRYQDKDGLSFTWRQHTDKPRTALAFETFKSSSSYSHCRMIV